MGVPWWVVAVRLPDVMPGDPVHGWRVRQVEYLHPNPRIAALAQDAMRVTWKEVARAAPPDVRQKAWQLALEEVEARETAHIIDRYREARESRLGQRGCVVWLTGLSGCGKSTIANELDQLLHETFPLPGSLAVE